MDDFIQKVKEEFREKFPISIQDNEDEILSFLEQKLREAFEQGIKEGFEANSNVGDSHAE